MPFLFLLLLTLACMPETWPSPPAWLGDSADLHWFAALTWAGVAFTVGLSALLARRTIRDAYSHLEGRESVLRQHASRRLYHLLGLFVFYGLALYILGWGWTVRNLCEPFGLRDAQGLPLLVPGAELLILAPFLVALILSWTFFYDAERALHDTGPPAEALSPFWNRRAYLSFHIRNNLALVFAPVALLVIEKSVRRFFPDHFGYDWVFTVVGLAFLGALFISLPWFIKIFLRLKPFPPGPLRDRLEASAQRLRFRCSDILLWNTHGGVANAMVAGILPSPRYVVLTDRLVSDLSADEVEAVFGHEVGHVKHHHMLYYLGFMLISLTAVAALVGALWDVATEQIPSLRTLVKDQSYQTWAMLPFVGLLGTYIFVVFGFLSRRCERQADIFGCRAVSCNQADCPGHDVAALVLPAGSGLCPTGIRTFIDALEKVARLNGISRDKPGWLKSWQHSTIARRVDFLQRVLADPDLELRFQRRVALVKWALLIGLFALLVFIGAAHPQGWELIRPF